MPTTVDAQELEAKVKDMYRAVAEEPQGRYHFEMGRPLAERLGYPGESLHRIPAGAIESFAGVGYFFDLAALRPGERVIDLGSGSGMDVFFAALAAEDGFGQVEFREGRIESLPATADSCDCVISNGVVNLAPDKQRVFAEAARVLKPGGRLAIADIVSEQQLKESIMCDADLWASCIGGAAQQDAYRDAIEAAGFRIEEMRDNPYEFISDRASEASTKYGVRSVSLLAVTE
jgi:SAM-dependent methyltransferase